MNFSDFYNNRELRESLICKIKKTRAKDFDDKAEQIFKINAYKEKLKSLGALKVWKKIIAVFEENWKDAVWENSPGDDGNWFTLSLRETKEWKDFFENGHLYTMVQFVYNGDWEEEWENIDWQDASTPELYQIYIVEYYDEGNGCDSDAYYWEELSIEAQVELYICIKLSFGLDWSYEPAEMNESLVCKIKNSSKKDFDKNCEETFSIDKMVEKAITDKGYDCSHFTQLYFANKVKLKTNGDKVKSFDCIVKMKGNEMDDVITDGIYLYNSRNGNYISFDEFSTKIKYQVFDKGISPLMESLNVKSIKPEDEILSKPKPFYDHRNSDAQEVPEEKDYENVVYLKDCPFFIGKEQVKFFKEMQNAKERYTIKDPDDFINKAKMNEG